MREAPELRYTEPIIQVDSLEGREVGWLGGRGGGTAWPAFGPEDKMLCLILPGSEGWCYFSVLAGMGRELRKVKWNGQGHRVSVCQMGFTLKSV